MKEIENVFISNEFECEAKFVDQSNRIKMGEVFQLQNSRFALVCIRCLEEFQYFSEFTLHVQEHLQNIISILPKESLLSPISSIETDKDALELQTDIYLENEIKVEVVPVEGDMVEYHSDGNEFNDNLIDSDSCDDLETNTPNVTKTDKELPRSKRNEKQSKESDKNVRKPITYFKKKCIDPKYEQLVNAFESIAYDQTNQSAFEALTYEITSSIFPSNIKDSVEIRMLAMYVQRGYNYERKDDKLLCPICDNDNGFNKLDSVRRHIMTHIQEPVFECGLCLAPFRAPRYLRKHLSREHLSDSRSFECVFCHQRYKYHRQLMNHMFVHKSDGFQCVPCGKKFKMRSFYQLHMKNVHSNSGGAGIECENLMEHTLPVSIADVKEKPLIYECYMCRKTFRLRRQLRNHMRIHIQPKQLCLQCGVTCSNSASMIRHLKLHDSNESKSHVCSICGKRFKVRQYLLRHRRKDHQVWADNQCPTCSVCGTLFNKKSLLHEHMKMHPFEETRNFICTICNHAAVNAYNLKRHMLSHSQKNWKCTICDKIFREMYAKEHMKTHIELGLHKCSVCYKAFKRAHGLKQHMYQHGIQAPEYKCDICSHSFSRSDKLLRHRRRHGVPLNYHCTVCDKGFITLKSFEVHESGHKKELKMEK